MILFFDCFGECFAVLLIVFDFYGVVGCGGQELVCSVYLYFIQDFNEKKFKKKQI